MLPPPPRLIALCVPARPLRRMLPHCLQPACGPPLLGYVQSHPIQSSFCLSSFLSRSTTQLHSRISGCHWCWPERREQREAKTPCTPDGTPYVPGRQTIWLRLSRLICGFKKFDTHFTNSSHRALTMLTNFQVLVAPLAPTAIWDGAHSLGYWHVQSANSKQQGTSNCNAKTSGELCQRAWELQDNATLPSIHPPQSQHTCWLRTSTEDDTTRGKRKRCSRPAAGMSKGRDVIRSLLYIGLRGGVPIQFLHIKGLAYTCAPCLHWF